MEANHNKILEIESELYALINSINKLYLQHQKGTISNIFFQKALKTAMNNLLKINFFIKENNLNLSDLLKKMDFTEKYYQAIDIINQGSSLNISDENNEKTGFNQSQVENKMSPSFLELPKITSEITSSFITLMDALKLEGLKGTDLIFRLFKDLKQSLKKFPGSEDFLSKIQRINHNIMNNSYKIIENRKFREKIVDDLYIIFKEFQEKLNIKT